jgi:hypothetical protein
MYYNKYIYVKLTQYHSTLLFTHCFLGQMFPLGQRYINTTGNQSIASIVPAHLKINGSVPFLGVFPLRNRLCPCQIPEK